MKRILVVDDNADNRYSMRLLLSEYDVLEADSGERALQVARHERPDCILLDVQMPGMDGLEVCRRLRAGGPTSSIPVIFVTAHEKDKQSIVRGLSVGGSDYVTKPFDKTELLARVRAMLRIRELQDRLEVLNTELEELVRRRTQELRQIHVTVPVGLYTLDASGRLTSFNRHLERMLGYAHDEVVGTMGIGDLFEPGYDTLYWLDLCRREGRTAVETSARHRDGHLLPVYDERVVNIDHVGEHAGFTGYMQDLSQRQRARAVLKEQETQAGVGRLAAGIVHEVANPIAGVVQYLDAMVRRLDKGETIPSEEMRRGAEVMRDALHRTTDLIQHLRGVARPTVHPVTRVDPLVLVEDIVTLMRHDLHTRGIRMAVRGDRGRHLVRGDAGRLSQVFLNLITNARDAMPDGGALTVDVFAEDSTVAVRFEDTGTGIAPEVRERIFDFLFTTKGEAGTGYGLTISRDIVAEHGGRIDLVTEVGHGSAFTVHLPQDTSGPTLA